MLALTLIDGAQRTFQNADALFSEARLLAGVGAAARAYFLHQISLEECGKIEILSAAVTQLLMGETVDMKRLTKAFTRHDSKNKTNAYFMPKSDAEEVAIKNNNVTVAVSEFKAMQEEFHADANGLKDASLYVDLDAKFSSPSDVITGEELASICQPNAEFIGLTQPKVDMLACWRQDLVSAVAEVAEMTKVFGFDKLDREGPLYLKALLESLEVKIAELARKRSAKRPAEE